VRRIQAPRGGWTAVLLAAVLLAVEAVIVAESWRGLTGFAALIGIHGPASYGVPVTLDGVSLVAALTALRAELTAEASGLYRLVLFAFTAASAAANWWHGERTGGREAALYLGGMSIAVAVVFALALRQIRHEDRRQAGRVTARLPRFSAAHWLRYPGLTWRAWSLAVRDGHASPRDALDAALSADTAKKDYSGRTALYRLFGSDDELLYIGITLSPDGRLKEHSWRKPWWPEVKRSAVEWHETWLTAAEAEQTAITAEEPKYNVSKRLDPGPAARREVPQTVLEAARAAYLASVEAGNPLSARAVADRFGISRRRADQIRAEVAQKLPDAISPRWSASKANSKSGAVRATAQDRAQSTKVRTASLNGSDHEGS
jgi:hypothetical protein